MAGSRKNTHRWTGAQIKFIAGLWQSGLSGDRIADYVSDKFSVFVTGNAIVNQARLHREIMPKRTKEQRADNIYAGQRARPGRPASQKPKAKIVSLRKPNHRWPDEQIKLAADMWAAGFFRREIAKRISEKWSVSIIDEQVRWMMVYRKDRFPKRVHRYVNVSDARKMKEDQMMSLQEISPASVRRA